IAWVLAEKHEELGIGVEVEASLNAGVAAANFGINRYLAMAASAEKSPLAAQFLADAKTRCDRSVEQLRRRVTRAIAHLCRLMDGEELMEVGSMVVSIST